MAFINPGNSGVIAFADYDDVRATDQRLFEANEWVPVDGANVADDIETLTTRATDRILQLFRQSTWWRSYYYDQSDSAARSAMATRGLDVVPALDPNRIIDRQADFTDLCVFFTLREYILPRVADFSREDNAEFKKIGFYDEKFRKLFQELIEDGSWYDFDDDGSVESTEKMPVKTNLVRIR